MTQLFLCSVRDARAKLLRVAEIAEVCLHRPERLIFFVEDDRSAKFLDDFLWKCSDASFLPHAIHSSSDWISISVEKKNINGAAIAFNLCPTPLQVDGPFRAIYDFEDLSHPDKRRLSSVRFDAYKKAGMTIVSC